MLFVYCLLFMPLYAFRAVLPHGRVTRGTRNAQNIADLTTLLAHEGCELIGAKPLDLSQKNRLSLWRWHRPSARMLAPNTLAVLCQQLAAMLKVGLSLPECLISLQSVEPLPHLRQRLHDLHRALESGEPFSVAAAQSPPLFDPLGLMVLRTGEVGGNLARALDQNAEALRWQHTWQKTIRRAVRYPLFLVAVAIGVTVFMMMAVVPQINTLLETLGTPLPWISRALIATTHAVGKVFPWIALIGLCIMVVVLFARRGSDRFSTMSDRVRLRLPLIGSLQQAFAEARFIRALVLVLEGGIAPVDALILASQTLGNRFLEKKSQQAAKAVEAGAPLAQACAGVLSPTACALVHHGETSGNLIRALRGAAESRTEEAHDRIKTMLAMLEPTLTALVGIQLAWIVVAVLGPVYGNLGVITQGL